MQKIRRKYEENRLFDCHVRGTICSLNEKRPWLNGITLRGRRRRRRQKGCISTGRRPGCMVLPARRAVCLFFLGRSPVVKVFFILRRRRHHTLGPKVRRPLSASEHNPPTNVGHNPRGFRPRHPSSFDPSRRRRVIKGAYHNPQAEGLSNLAHRPSAL